MSYNDGKYLEELVLLFERSLEPNARIEHNVQMPILNSRMGNKTQCDIVIWTGKYPRETITIVEVQDRDDKVKPNDFRGWEMKLQEVGAQHLICVSKQEFPKSIKEKALLSKNKIYLINISETPPEMIPMNFLKTKFIYHDFILESVSYLQIKLTDNKMQEKCESILKTNGDLRKMIFSYDKRNLVSLFLICQDQQKDTLDIQDGVGFLDINANMKQNLFILCDGEFSSIGIEFKYIFSKTITNIPINILSYTQNENTLVWMIKGYHKTPTGPAEFKIPIKRNGDGYIVSNMEFLLPMESKMTMSIVSPSNVT